MQEAEIKKETMYFLTNEKGTDTKVYVIGFDILENKWVASCSQWLMGVSYLEPEDYEFMREIL